MRQTSVALALICIFSGGPDSARAQDKEEEAVLHIAAFLDQVGNQLAAKEVDYLGPTFEIDEIVMHLKGILEASVIFASGEGDAEMTIVIKRKE